MMTWANYMVGQTKLRHPECWGITDVGRLLGGRAGEEFLSVAFVLCTSCHRTLAKLTDIRHDFHCRVGYSRRVDRA